MCHVLSATLSLTPLFYNTVLLSSTVRILKFINVLLSIMSEKQWTPFYLDLDFWKWFDPFELDILLIKTQSRLESPWYSLKWPLGRGSTRKGCHFQALSVWEGWDFTCWSICKGRENCHFGWLKTQKGLTDALHGCEKSWVNGLVLWFIHILKTVHVQQLRGMQSSKLGMWKGYHCQ